MEKFDYPDLDITMNLYMAATVQKVPVSILILMTNSYCNMFLDGQQINLVIDDIQSKRNQRHMIKWLHDYGFNQIRIATLLDIPQPNVSYHLKRYEEKPPKEYVNYELRSFLYMKDKSLNWEDWEREYTKYNKMYVPKRLRQVTFTPLPR